MDPAEHRQEIRQRIRALIDRHGQMVQSVHLSPGDPPDAQPFLYTIGNHERGLPELLIVGTDQSEFANVLNRLGRMQRERGAAFADEERVSLGGAFPVRIVDAGEVGRTRYATFVGMFYGTRRYQVRQVLLCDPAGRWPDDPACAKPYSGQPVLSSIERRIQ